MRIETILDELKNNNNLVEVANGIVVSPEEIDEDKYYYYLIPESGTYRMYPVQVVGGIIQELKKVNGKVEDPTRSIQAVKYIFTLDKKIGPNLEELIKEHNTEYTNASYIKYIETAKRYEELRETLMSEIITMNENSILYQGDKHYLPTTTAAFSLGYNEDSYIKSSIAYETEMYMRSIFSKYGILDIDLRSIFSVHNLKEAFLKLPRTVRTKVYATYKKELQKKTQSINEKLIDEILQNNELTEILDQIEKILKNKKDQLKAIKLLIEIYKRLLQEDNKPIEIIERIEKILDIKQSKTNNNNTYNHLKIINDYKINFNQKDYYTKESNYNSDNKYNIINYPSLYKYIDYLNIYDSYQILDLRYTKLISKLKVIMTNINKITIKIQALEREKNKQDNIYKHKGSYSISNEEYNNILNKINKLKNQLNELNDLKLKITNNIATIEDKMTNFIFKDEFKMETAYQDNRYTYESETNNNYDNMLMFLNVIRSVALGSKTKGTDYDDLYRNIAKKQGNYKRKYVIRANGLEIKNFNQMFSRRDQRFTCNKRKTKEGIISRFFKSKKESKLDAIYAAELRYLGALLLKEKDDNLTIAEEAMSCELYLKGLLRSREDTHSLKELFLKVDNKTKSMIIRKVNKLLGLNLTKNEFLTILSKNTIDQAFSEYRYLYEKNVNKEDLDFIGALVNSLHIIVCNKIKYKSPYYDEIDKLKSSSGQENSKK